MLRDFCILFGRTLFVFACLVFMLAYGLLWERECFFDTMKEFFEWHWIDWIGEGIKR